MDLVNIRDLYREQKEYLEKEVMIYRKGNYSGRLGQKQQRFQELRLSGNQ